MAGLASGAFSFFLMLACVTVGLFIRPMLPEHHRDQQTLEAVRLAISILVTFVALVLGLLTASSKGHFDAVSDDYRAYATDIIQLDALLRDYGPEAALARALLRSYTAAVIASTWPSEPPPAGDNYPQSLAQTFQGSRVENQSLGLLLQGVDTDIRKLMPKDDYQRQLAADCLDQFKELTKQRWRIIQGAHSTISPAFFVVMLVWLSIVFFCFGLCSRRNATVVIVAVVCAFSTASSLYVILDMDSPIGGQIVIPSQPMRDALTDIER